MMDNAISSGMLRRRIKTQNLQQRPLKLQRYPPGVKTNYILHVDFNNAQVGETLCIF